MNALFPDNNPRTQAGNYRGYRQGATYPGFEEPLSTHADHFTSYAAYGWGSYTKGAVVLAQLRYILGMETFSKALKRYYYEWRFKHPDLNDFIRVMEKTSGLELHWYFEYMINSTHNIDYAIAGISNQEGKSVINLKREGVVPMPIDISVTLTNGQKKDYYIPLGLMRGEKITDAELKADWPWTHPEYELTIDIPVEQIEKVVIDASGMMADVNLDNNTWEAAD
jgi:hypothetical protein